MAGAPETSGSQTFEIPDQIPAVPATMRLTAHRACRLNQLFLRNCRAEITVHQPGDGAAAGDHGEAVGDRNNYGHAHMTLHGMMHAGMAGVVALAHHAEINRHEQEASAMGHRHQV
jgi:hypothetical protein